MRSGRSLAVGAAVGLAAVVVVALVARDEGRAAPSFSRDVAPILQDKCADCHQLGGIAPFSLVTAAAARTHSAAIAAAVESRRMPPWPPGSESPQFVGEDERRLPDEELETVVEWARSGAPVDGAALQAPPPETLSTKRGEWAYSLSPERGYRPQREGDDYRCFLLDMSLDGWAFATSATIRPGVPSMVHHVILFRAKPDEVEEAERLDARSSVAGWPCFGGTGLGAGVEALDDAGWIAAWAPGGGTVRYPSGTGAELEAGGGIVMQVHYHRRNETRLDRTGVHLTLVSGSADLEPATTMLLPAPIELPCADGEQGPLCDRDAAIADLTRERGASAALLPAGLQVLCRGSPFGTPSAGQGSSCDRGFDARTTIHGVAGHMHLLGRSIRVELNPGTDRSRVLLDIPRWDFHWQNAYTFAEPVVAEPGDRVRVTCRHDAALREGPPRYVVWGEGTMDEMCLGVLQVTRG